MKTKHEAACDHADKPNMSNNRMFRSCTIEDFKAGIEFAESWININEELPEFNGEYFYILAKSCYECIYLILIEDHEEIAEMKEYYTHWRPINRP